MKILIISDEENIAHNISSKLVFLRNDDKIVITDYKNYKRDITANHPEIVLVHENSRKSKTVIKNLVTNKNITVILIAKSYDSQAILSYIDLGADDFILENAEDFEYVVRIVKHLKFNSTKITSFRNAILLEQLNAINSNSGFYEYKYSKQAIENTIDNELITLGSFIILSKDDKDIDKFSLEKLFTVFKSVLRNSDVVSHGKNSQIYIFLPNTPMNGAIVVYNKIQEQVDFKLHAGISDICGYDFDDIVKHSEHALTNAVATNLEYVLYQETENTIDSWLSDSPKKSFKIFTKVFNKKLEKVITPIFYRLQQTYEQELSDTKITYVINENKCSFDLTNINQESSLNIIYSGFSSVVISIVHKGLNSPENKDIKLQLSELTEKELVGIIENFVEEFKNQSTDL